MIEQLKTIRAGLEVAACYTMLEPDAHAVQTSLAVLAQLEAMVREQEPICWAENDGEGGILWDQESCFSDDPAWFNNPMPLYATQVAQQPQAEPDAYCITTPDGCCISTDPRCMHQPQAEAVPLSTDESRRIARLQALSEQIHSHSSVYERKRRQP